MNSAQDLTRAPAAVLLFRIFYFHPRSERSQLDIVFNVRAEGVLNTAAHLDASDPRRYTRNHDDHECE